MNVAFGHWTHVGGHLDVLQEQTYRQLQTLPGIDARLASGLVRMGVTSLDDLARRDPHQLSRELLHVAAIEDLPYLLAAAVHAARAGNRFTHLNA